MFLHYLVKCICSYIIVIDYSCQKHALKSEFFLKVISKFSILWATMVTFFVSFTVTGDGFRLLAKIILSNENRALTLTNNVILLNV